MAKLIAKTYRVGKHHDMIVKKVAKKMKMSEGEVVRRRITSFDEMVEALQLDMQNAEHIDVTKE